MSTVYDEKPKNRERRVFQWWLLVIGFWVGIIVAVVVIASRPQQIPSQAINPSGQISMEAMQLTATSIIRDATLTAAPLIAPANQESDPIQLTATAIILEATRMAGS